MRLQTVLHAVFPPECLNCGARVDEDFSLCGAMLVRHAVHFRRRLRSVRQGAAGPDRRGERLICEECHTIARPWEAGRAVMGYADVGRKLVLGLKHGDRADIARAAGPWMARAGADLLRDDPILVPVPLHPLRLAARRYNQSAQLALSMAAETGRRLRCAPCPLARDTDAGWRDRDARFENLSDAIAPHPRSGASLKGRAVVLIDDVMTSGATFAAAAEACRHAGASHVRVMALARVGNDT
jgi:predicted amidophosphoribosyltransferase